jgi:hypothetical protein
MQALRPALLCVLLSGMSTRLPAQVAPTHDFLSGPRVGVGYHGVIPDVLAGGGLWYLSGPRRFGVFVDGKTTVPNPASHQNFCPPGLQGPCTVESVESRYNHWALRDRERWLILNGGGMYAFSGEFALLLGGGVARLSQYREYIDEEEDHTQRVTWEGNYLVPHEPRDQMVANLVIGGLIRAGNRVAFSFGYETAPAGMTVGLFVVLP